MAEEHSACRLMIQPALAIRKTSQTITYGGAWIAMLLGALVLVGWWSATPILTSVVRGYVTMKPNTAMGLLLGGIALRCAAAYEREQVGGGREWLLVLSRTAAAGCALIGAITLFEYIAGMRGGTDELLARMTGADASTATPGRMAVTTAASLLALGAGIGLLDARRALLRRISQWCLATGIAVPLSVLVGYIYHVIPVRGVGQGLQMALHTAIGALALGIGGFAARPDRDFVRTMSAGGAGGLLVRRILPAALGLPILLGALSLMAEQRGLLDGTSAGASVTTGTMFFLAWLIWRTASYINRTDEERVRAERERSVAQAAQVTAELASAEKTQFMAVMSHELRTPLNAIIGYAGLFNAGIYGETTPEQRNALGRILASSRRLLGLVEQVLSLSRNDAAGHDTLDIRTIAVCGLLESLEPQLKAQRVAKGIIFHIVPCDASLLMSGDRARIEQILHHLLTNAINFTDRGGTITVSASSDDRLPDVARGVSVDIADTGRGVPAEMDDAIFAPFVQAENGLTRRTDGAGLGLAISRDLARAMGGDVTLVRSGSSGSVFRLTVPAARMPSS